MSGYHKLSVANKERATRLAQREPAVTCPRCAATVMPADLIAHGERCDGVLPAPHPCSRWLVRTHALQLVSPAQLDKLVQLGLVRTNAEARYCERDVVLACAWMRALEAL